MCILYCNSSFSSRPGSPARPGPEDRDTRTLVVLCNAGIQRHSEYVQSLLTWSRSKAPAQARMGLCLASNCCGGELLSARHCGLRPRGAAGWGRRVPQLLAAAGIAPIATTALQVDCLLLVGTGFILQPGPRSQSRPGARARAGSVICVLTTDLRLGHSRLFKNWQ